MKTKEVSSDEDISMPEYLSDVSPTGDIDDEDLLKPHPNCFVKLSGKPKYGNWWLDSISFNNKKQKIYYIGKILSELNEESEYEISFFKKSSNARFVMPDLADMEPQYFPLT